MADESGLLARESARPDSELLDGGIRGELRSVGEFFGFAATVEPWHVMNKS
jgi:hypothetical protein